MNYQSSNFVDEDSWNENVKKGLKAEIPLIFKWIFQLCCYSFLYRTSLIELPTVFLWN